MPPLVTVARISPANLLLIFSRSFKGGPKMCLQSLSLRCHVVGGK
jgi:hypothetical protein